MNIVTVLQDAAIYSEYVQYNDLDFWNANLLYIDSFI